MSAEPNVLCTYCSNPAQLTKGAKLFPNNPIVAKYNYWECIPCNARVGTHVGTTVPLGNLGNAELRHWKKKAHLAFDPLWKSGTMARGKAYAWLAEKLVLSADNCHIGKLSLDQCKETVKVAEQYIENCQNIRHLEDKEVYKHSSKCPRCADEHPSASLKETMIIVKCRNCKFRWQEALCQPE